MSAVATMPWAAAYPADVAWDMPIPPETLPALFDATVARFSARPAMEFLGRSWTYAELGDAVARMAAGLRGLGAGPGVRVGLCLPNGPWYPIAYFAALRTGATVVNFSPLLVEEEMAAQAGDCAAAILVTIDLDPILPRVLGLLARPGLALRQVVVARFADGLTPVKSALFRLLKRRMLAPIPRGDARVVEMAALLRAGPLAGAAPCTPGDLAVLQYTGGTTGRPKGVMLTHANLCANLRQVNAWRPQARAGHESFLAVIPFFHVFALTVILNGAVATGAEIVMLPRYDWKAVRAALRRRRPTCFPGVPTLFKAVLEAGATAADLASVQACISGGAPLPLQVRLDFEAMAGATLVEGYGLTEASPVCFCNPVAGENRAGTIGIPLPGVRAEIRSLEDPLRAVGPGERGELCVAGPNVMAGYYNRPEDTAAVMLPGGFLRTGDVGIMAADGYVELVDRIKDLIIVSGFNVYPRAIEEALYRHPDVVAATVVGMSDPHRGEAPAAFVEPRPGSDLTVAALRVFLADKLSAIEMPRLIELRETLPRTAVGKLSKTELRAELSQR